MAAEEIDKQRFIAELALQYDRRLRSYLSHRLRNRADAADFAQEVYLRLLRVERPFEIRSPEAYLFTIATHLIYEQSTRQAAAPPLVEIETLAETLSAEEADPATRADAQQRFEVLARSVRRLSPRLRTTLLMHRREGYSLEEIGARLGISRNVAKKYLAKALAYCRQGLRKE